MEQERKTQQSQLEPQMYCRFMHDTNSRFIEGVSYLVVQDMPEYNCCLVVIKGDKYRKVDLIYYYQSHRYYR